MPDSSVQNEKPKAAFSKEKLVEMKKGNLDPNYKIKFNSVISDLSSDFANAYEAENIHATRDSAPLYALVFNVNFPIRMKAIETLRKIQHPSLVQVVAFGKTITAGTKAERFAVILERPQGVRLSQALKDSSPFNELYVADKVMEQLAGALALLAENRITHGRINPDNIFYNKAAARLIIGEPISEFCGYSQMAAYEDIDRVVAHPAGKGDSDPKADYFALGMVLLFMLTARQPFAGKDNDSIIDTRFEHGSHEAAISETLALTKIRLSTRIHTLLKGLLSDNSAERWGRDELDSWMKKFEIIAQASKMHKLAATGFMFDDKEYFGIRYLAYDIGRKWNIAKRTLKIADLSRWFSLSLKRPDLSEKVEYLLDHTGNSEVILPDHKITRIISILDPSGPIRHNELSCRISGFGNMLASCYMGKDKANIQNIGAVFAEGLVENWIRQQPDPELFSYSMLGWSPAKIRVYMRRSSMGFGMERALYEFNKFLPCQSKLMADKYVSNLADLLVTLDKSAESLGEKDAQDRHLAAFIASHINLTDEMKIKSLQNFPRIAKHPGVMMLGLLTVAQSEARVKSVKGVTEWMKGLISAFSEDLHSKFIRKEMQGKLRVAAKDGKLATLFQAISNPVFIQRDASGFREARMQYKALGAQIQQLKTQGHIRRVAYQLGLRISVTISYLVCIASALYVYFVSG